MNFELDILTREELEAIEELVQVGTTILKSADMYKADAVEPLTLSLKLARRHFLAKPPTTPDDSLDTIRRSRWFAFWSELEADEFVRWTKHPNAVYQIVSGVRADVPPDANRRPYGVGPSDRGMWLELRRASRKTFWCHVSQIRPIDWAP
jgi:hypothetical protein